VTTTEPARTSAGPTGFDLPLRVTAKMDYAIRALAELAASGSRPMTAQRLSQAQAIPQGFLLSILGELRRAGLIRSHRGAGAGYELARPAASLTLAEIINVIHGDLSRPALEEIAYPGAAGPLRDVWLAVRSSLASVLGSVTLADVARGSLPAAVMSLARQPGEPAGVPADAGGQETVPVNALSD
jgi:Rrf2 family protein